MKSRIITTQSPQNQSKYRANYQLIYLLFACCLGLMLAVPKLSADSNIALTEVIFSEVEAGTDEYLSRLLLGDQYLRLDDGKDAGDFVLFDLNDQSIHSFNQEDQTHLLILPAKDAGLDFDLDYSKETKSLESAPKINDVTPVETRFLANGQLCRTAVSVEGLMPKVLAALKNYEATLAGQAKRSFERIPASMRKPCYMANNYLHATDYLNAGFPLYLEDYDGKKRRLVSFKFVEKPVSFLSQPEGFRLYYATEPE